MPLPGFGNARALVVQDDEPARTITCTYLRRDAFQVIEADNGMDALALLRRGCVDIALLDALLPEIDGLEVLRRIRRESTVPIILVTGRAEPVSRVAGLEAGADDHMIKPFSPAEVSARLRGQLRRARGFDAEDPILKTGPLELDLSSRRCLREGEEIELTRREFELLGTLLRYPGRIHTRHQLLELVWGTEHITTKTVDVHIHGLRRKLGSAIRIGTLRGVGYLVDVH